MIRSISQWFRRVVSDAFLWIETRELDPFFYVSHYDDLRSLETEKNLRRHYARHGRQERRFPSKAALLARGNGGSDLKRTSRLLDSLRPLRNSSTKMDWRSTMSVPQVLAWCGDRLSTVPTDAKQVRALFERRGIDEQWPLRFDYIFDANFYISTYKVASAAREDPSKAYREFLTHGFHRGHAPNEAAFLYAYLGGMPFPEHFDWKGYGSRAMRFGPVNRISALRHLFEAGHRDFAPYIKYLAEDSARVLSSVGRYALARERFETAANAFEMALASRESGDVACLLGDSLRMLGHKDQALAAYKRSIASGSAPIWSYLHCVDILCERRQFDACFEMLRQGFKPWRHRVDFKHKLERCIDLFFQHRSGQAHALYRRGIESTDGNSCRASGDDLLTEALDRIRDLYREIDELPAHTGGQPDGYVAILANDGLRQCTHYRVEQKVQEFEQAGIPVRVFSHNDVANFMASLVGARAAIFYRVAAFPNVIRAILHANSMGLTTYYEIDDLIFDPACYPDSFDSFEGQIGREEYAGLQFGVPLFRYALSMCKASIASTEALSSKMRELTATTLSIILPNGLDSRNQPWIEIGAHPKHSETTRVRLFYGSGTKAHNSDFNELVGPALLEIMKRHTNVDLIIAGHLKLRSDLMEMTDRVHVFPFTSDVNAYWSILSSCDINLAVLHPGDVADCKSEIKWLEAAILQIPSIVSDTATYRNVITEGETGYVADTGADWVRLLEELVSNAATRRRVGANARKKAMEAYSLEAGARVIRQAFDNISKGNDRSREGKRLRVLVCNVFFHPQSHGGATRVVEDNVRSFMRNYDGLEIGVFCSDDGVSPPGQLRLGSFEGAPVYRLSTPIEPGMDWRPFNPENGSSFGRVLDHFAPDIIHFHCIQRLTASIAEEALRRDIPYVITLHDGWWISDHQFLVDEDGFLRMPTPDIINDCKNRPTPLESMERRQRLKSLLQNADARFSVSSAFAKIYEDAGISEVCVVENGLPELRAMTRRPRADGRLALGHVGGRSAHKGAFLVEAALRQGAFKNLHLTMVDGTLSQGETVETMWGTTPVTLTGPYPQSEVHELYGKLNVLLAPSTWPESYGLVTREALSHRLWVIASDLGAIGEGVVSGQNGHVIDTRTAADLKRVLAEMDANRDVYLQPTPLNASALRPIEEQAKELHEHYWQVARNRGKTYSTRQNRNRAA